MFSEARHAMYHPIRECLSIHLIRSSCAWRQRANFFAVCLTSSGWSLIMPFRIVSRHSVESDKASACEDDRTTVSRLINQQTISKQKYPKPTSKEVPAKSIHVGQERRRCTKRTH